MPISFNFLPAGSGDAILISADGFNILVDGGNNNKDDTAYQKLYNQLDELKRENQCLDLVVLTHIDDDHIRGIIEIFSADSKFKNFIKSLWFNVYDEYMVDINSKLSTSKVSIPQLVKFEKLINQNNSIATLHKNISIERFTQPLEIYQDIKITLLSPTDAANNKINELYRKHKPKKKTTVSNPLSDYKKTIPELAAQPSYPGTTDSNKACIAFILTYKEIFNFLLLADAHITFIEEELKNKGYSENNKLKLEFVKLSHHGSSRNLTESFLSLINTNTFVISSNGSHGHPHKETLSKIITHYYPQPVKFIFNNENVFSRNRIFSFSEKEEYGFELELADKNKLTFG